MRREPAPTKGSRANRVNLHEKYDHPQFDEIIGVVCTPFATYSSDDRTLAFTKPNLRVSSSMLELRDWLAAN
jgi:hypothetical protein